MTEDLERVAREVASEWRPRLQAQSQRLQQAHDDLKQAQRILDDHHERQRVRELNGLSEHAILRRAYSGVWMVAGCKRILKQPEMVSTREHLETP